MIAKIVVVTRKTRLEELVERFNTKAQARFYIEHSGGDFSQYEREHTVYQAALRELYCSLNGMANLHLVERSYLTNYVFGQDDLVVTVGIDGLVVNTAKYLDEQPLVAVNPDPAHIDGLLLPFSVADAPTAVQRVMEGDFRSRPITMAEAVLDDGQRLLAFNDLFIGRLDHISARYSICHGSSQEQHSSSGIIVSTGAGATGWLSSLFNMAEGILQSFGAPAEGRLERPFLDWETDRLIFVVREPFVSKTSGAELVCGAISSESPLVIKSTMPSGGAIFSDGVAADYLAFNASATATVSLADTKTHLVIG